MLLMRCWLVGHSEGNEGVTFPVRRGDRESATFGNVGGKIFRNPTPMNNSKVVIFLSCLFAATLTAPLVTAAGHGGGGFGAGHSSGGHPGMGMPGRPGMGMRSGGNRHDHFDHHHDHFNHHENEENEENEDIDFIFIGSFGFPWW